MLTFFTGTDLARKKQRIEAGMTDAAGKGKKVFLIVPEQSAFNRDRDILFRLGERGSDAFGVTGLERFVCETLEENGIAAKPQAQSAARTAVMSIAAESVKDSLSVFASHSARPSTVNELLGTYDEIKQAGATPEQLGRVSAGNTGVKARELSLIFSAYEALINERFSDPSDNISRLCGFLAKNPGYFENCVFFFDDFRGFTGEQVKLTALLCADADEVTVSVTAPDLNENDGNEAFSHSRRNARAIRQRAAAHGVQCRVECTDGENKDEDALSFLRTSLFSGEQTKFTGNADNVCIYNASTVPDECAFAAMQIKKLLESGKYRCRDIGVFQRSDAYTYQLTAELKRCGIPVCEDSRKALGEYPLVRMVLTGVEAAVRGLSSQRIFTYLKTGVAGVAEEQCNILENYVTMWSIDGKAWERDFKGNPDGYGADFNEDRRGRLDEINGIRRKAVEPLLHLRASLGEGDPLKSCTAVYTLIDETGAKGEFLRLAQELSGSGFEKEAIACARVWDETADALDALYAALGSGSVSPVRFSELLTLILCGDSLGEIPAGIDQIVIGTADRTRFLMPKAVFVLGLTDGDFPLRSVRGGVFTAAEKRELAAGGIELESVPEKIYGEERLIAYNAVTAASEKLFLSYPEISASGETAQKSEVIEEIEGFLPGCRKIKSGEISGEERIFSPASALEAYASRVGENSVFTASLREALGKIGGYAEKTEAVDYAHMGLPASFEDKTVAERLFGTQLYISPSRLEAYSKCPFMYYCRYGIKAKANTPAMLDARINGLLVHRVFEVLLGSFPKDRLSSLSYEERKSTVDKIADEYIEENMGGAAELSPAVLRQLERQKKIMLDILNRLIAEFNTSSFEVQDVELEIKNGAEVEPFTVSDGSIAVTLHGTVDRVDTFKDGDTLYFRVMDYKTGGKDFVLGDVLYGLNMQMLVYMTALWLNGGGKYKGAVPAGILYVPARSGGNNVGREAGAKEIEAQKLENGKMNGIILKNESVLRGMEHEAAGVFIKQKIDKGKLTGDFYTLDDMRRIRKKLEKVILDEVHKMLDGSVPAIPVIDNKAYSHTCEYCEFSSVCRRESDGAIQDYKKLNFYDVIKSLQEEEEE